jgi:hypothetical protein
VLNVWLLHFGEWIGATWFSVALHESFYAYGWIESLHVITLMISLGMLIIIDLRMLGLWLTNVPASKIAQRLDRPMLIGFSIMVVTGVLLYVGIPIRTTQSLWFRIKIILLVAAVHQRVAVPAATCSSQLGSWDVAAVPPRRTRIAAAGCRSLCGHWS